MRAPRSVLAAVFAAAAFVAVLWITRSPGPGLDPDAFSYLGAAESFARSGALRIPTGTWDSPDGTSPLAHFPPGFSLAIAGPVALGAHPVQAARVVEALSAAATAALVVSLGAGFGGPLTGALAGALLFVTPALAVDHLRVLSEPLFLAFAVLTLWLMLRAPARPLSYGVAAALAGAVRYAGVSLGGAAALWALSRPGTPRHRLGAAALALAPTVLVQGGWALRLDLESATERSFGFTSGLGATLQEGWDTVTRWLAPGVEQPALRVVIACLVLVVAVALIVGAARRRRDWLAATGLVAACYAGLVLFSRLFADPGIPFDQRLLSPLFLLGSLAVAVAGGSLWGEARPRMRAGGALALVVWLAASGWQTIATVSEDRDGGWGYGDIDWLSSDLVRWLRTEGAGYELFTNNPADAWFATGRRSRELPEAVDSDTVAAFGAALLRSNGVVVGFWNPLGASVRPEELAGRLALPIIARLDGGLVWGPKSP
jgi:hypothetical protein